MSMRHFLKTQDIAPPLDGRGYRDLFGGGGGSSPAGTVNTIQNADPWSGIQPYLQDVFQRGQGLANRGPYTGPYLAPQSAYTTQAIAQQAAGAQDPNSLISRAQQQLGDTIGGKYLSIDSNPAAQAAMGAAQRAVNEQFTGDNFGSSANREWLGRGTASAVAPMLQQERQNQLMATQMAPGLQNANNQLLASAGAAQDAYAQAGIGAQQAQYQAPWDLLRQYQQSIAGGAAAGGGSSSTQSPYFTNPLASAMGMGIGGLNLYNGMNTAGLLSGPAAAGIGYGAAGTAAAASMVPDLLGNLIFAI